MLRARSWWFLRASYFVLFCFFVLRTLCFFVFLFFMLFGFFVFFGFFFFLFFVLFFFLFFGVVSFLFVFFCFFLLCVLCFLVSSCFVLCGLFGASFSFFTWTSKKKTLQKNPS